MLQPYRLSISFVAHGRWSLALCKHADNRVASLALFLFCSNDTPKKETERALFFVRLFFFIHSKMTINVLQCSFLPRWFFQPESLDHSLSAIFCAICIRIFFLSIPDTFCCYFAAFCLCERHTNTITANRMNRETGNECANVLFAEIRMTRSNSIVAQHVNGCGISKTVLCIFIWCLIKQSGKERYSKHPMHYLRVTAFLHFSNLNSAYLREKSLQSFRLIRLIFVCRSLSKRFVCEID